MHISIKHYLHGPYSFVCDESGVEQVFDVPPPPHYKWLYGDSINAENNKVVYRGRIPTIVGILYTTNRIGYGFSARGVPLYMFYPLDEKWPPFTVACRDHHSTNMIVCVQFEHWTDKWPRGGLNSVLGPVGNMDVEKDALRLRVAPPPLRIGYDLDKIANGNIEKHTECDYDFVCNIDPDGCEDVDDVFGWKLHNDGILSFMIGIADVASFIHESNPLSTLALHKCASVYENTMVRDPMFPTQISTTLASLRQDDTPRPVIALVYSIAPNGCILNSTWEQVVLKVTRSFTYDTVLEYSDVCKQLRFALESVRKHDIGDDPHNWVAEGMIEYNRCAAEILRMHGMGVLRAHAGISHTDFATLAAKTGCKEIEMLGMSAGRYLPATCTADAIAHSGLGLSVYTHASSPLRRYADLYNQRCLKHILFDDYSPTPNYILHLWLNARMREIKQFERDMWFLENLKMDMITHVDAYLIKHKKNGKWQLFVPLWKRKFTGIPSLKTDEVYALGDKVHAEVYCDLKQTSWSQRFVCRFS